jgi:hypothetical protein
MDRSKETVDFAYSNLRIAEGEDRVRKLAKVAAELRRNGQDATETDRLLAATHDALRVWREHQRQVVSGLAETD